LYQDQGGHPFAGCGRGQDFKSLGHGIPVRDKSPSKFPQSLREVSHFYHGRRHRRRGRLGTTARSNLPVKPENRREERIWGEPSL
jgi:hypothetical protein